MKFGDDDLVYGPSANGSLVGLKNKAGGKLLSDMGNPYDKGYPDWLSYSKSVMEDALAAGNMIHFYLTNMDDIDNILNNTGPYANTVTAGELNHIFNNWSRFKEAVKFYMNGKEVSAPWLN